MEVLMEIVQNNRKLRMIGWCIGTNAIDCYKIDSLKKHKKKMPFYVSTRIYIER